MEYGAIALALLNFAIAAARLFFCIKSRRLMTIAWFLIAYFSFFFIPVAASSEFEHRMGFTLDLVPITHERIFSTLVYVLAFNIIFLTSEFAMWKLVGVKSKKIVWELPSKSTRLDRMSIIYLIGLLAGSALYGVQTLKSTYMDYVETQASWSIVLLWTSTPYITIAAMRKQYVRAILACIPFIYFAYHLKVRSFALLSLIPIAIIYALQVAASQKQSLMRLLKFAFYGGALGVILIMSSAIIMSTKAGNKDQGFALPDSGMPFGSVIMMELSDKYHTKTGFDALTLYGRNLVNPFNKVYEKLFGGKLDEVEDPPYLMGRLYEGSPKNWPARFHYPALWYADAYFAFGMAGLTLAALWGCVLVMWESIMTSRPMLFALLLPFFSWQVYMLVRGATAISTVPYSYAVYFAVIIAAAIGGPSIFRKIKAPLYQKTQMPLANINN